jgi:tetratricopeptide (TPR) repeat protein
MAAAMAFHQAIPILSVADLERSRDYYVNVLGFKVDFYETNIICSVSRGECNLFLVQGDQGRPGTWVWIGVGDAVALHEEFTAKGAKIRVAPTNRHWALEMQVEDPDGHVLRFGSEPREDEPVGEWLDQDGVRWAPLAGGRWKRADQLTDADRANQRAAAAARKGDREGARQALAEAVELWSKSGDAAQWALALRDLAEMERRLEHLDCSLKHYEAAVALIRKANDAGKLAFLLRHLGDVYQEMKRLPDADAAYAEALALYRAVEKPHILDIANTLRRQAIVAHDSGRTADALRLWREAHALYRKFGHPPGIEESNAQVEKLAKKAE